MSNHRLYDKIKDGRYYQAMIEDSSSPILMCDSAGSFMDANKAASRFLGYSVDELRKMSFQQVTHRDDIVASMEMINATIFGGMDHFDMVKRYVNSKGDTIWAAVRVNAVRSDDGKLETSVVHIVPLIGCSDDIIRDITEKARTSRKERTCLFSFMAGVITVIIIGILCYIARGQ